MLLKVYVTKLVYFELQEVMSAGARSGQTATYRQFAIFTMGNEVVTELCLIFVY